MKRDVNKDTSFYFSTISAEDNVEKGRMNISEREKAILEKAEKERKRRELREGNEKLCFSSTSKIATEKNSQGLFVCIAKEMV